MGLELGEQLGWDAPDVLVYPTGGGTGLVGIWKAYEELGTMGWVKAGQPRFVAVQAEGCAPLVRAWRDKAETTSVVENPMTHAPGLRAPGPFAGRLLLRTLPATAGSPRPVAERGRAGGPARRKGDCARRAGRGVGGRGGGGGGATAAKYVRLLAPGVEVILIEPNRQFVSCPFSNLVLAGLRSIDSLTMGYDGLRKHGVRIIHETAGAIEPDTKRVRLGEGYLQYDRLVVSPRVDFQWEQVEGLAQSQDTVLHAWKAGPQTVQLAQQLAAMPDGGVFVLSIPLAAYRCPPGPYERASMAAFDPNTNKPRSKLIVLDANQNIISKTALFRAAWQAYPNIDYRPASRVIGGDPAH